MKFNKRNIVLWVIVLSLQLLVFNKLNIGPYINIYIYPLLILLLPFDIAGWLLLVGAFFLGLLIDLFTGTLGMHIFALVLLAGIRPSVTRMLSLDKIDQGSSINVKQHGFIVVLFYLFVLFFTHHLCYFLLETFASSGVLPALLRTVSSTFFSILLSMILLLLFHNSRKNER